MGNINLCFSCDDNYSKYAGVAIASILHNAHLMDNINIYILDGGITEHHKNEIMSLKYIKDCSITFVEIDSNLFNEYKKIHTHSYITIATYYRLKLATLLPNVEKIIYLDCDIVVNSSLSELFNVDIENYTIAGVKDINKKITKKNPKYINAGMVLFNLAKIRENDVENKFLEWTYKNYKDIKVGDQSIINETCKDSIKIVDDTWNVQSSNFINRSSYTVNPKIVHFVAKNKPWNGKSFSYHKNLYFKYLQLTPWKLTEEELNIALKSTALSYVKYRPLFLFRPRFYVALFETYIKPLWAK